MPFWAFGMGLSAENVGKSQGKCKTQRVGKNDRFRTFFCVHGRPFRAKNGVRVFVFSYTIFIVFFSLLQCPCLSFFSDVYHKYNTQHTTHNTHETHRHRHTDTQTHRHNTQHTHETHETDTTHETHTTQRCVKTVDPMWSGFWASPAWICLLSHVSAVIQLPAPTVAAFPRHDRHLCFD